MSVASACLKRAESVVANLGEVTATLRPFVTSHRADLHYQDRSLCLWQMSWGEEQEIWVIVDECVA